MLFCDRIAGRCFTSSSGVAVGRSICQRGLFRGHLSPNSLVWGFIRDFLFKRSLCVVTAVGPVAAKKKMASTLKCDHAQADRQPECLHRPAEA